MFLFFFQFDHLPIKDMILNFYVHLVIHIGNYRLIIFVYFKRKFICILFLFLFFFSKFLKCIFCNFNYNDLILNKTEQNKNDLFLIFHYSLFIFNEFIFSFFFPFDDEDFSFFLFVIFFFLFFNNYY